MPFNSFTDKIYKGLGYSNDMIFLTFFIQHVVWCVGHGHMSDMETASPTSMSILLALDSLFVEIGFDIFEVRLERGIWWFLCWE